MKKYFLIIILPLLITSCKRDDLEEQMYTPTSFTFVTPEHFPKPDFPSDNPMTEEGVALGHKFYSDPILSSNGLSCRSCHTPERSYSTPVFISSSGDSISVPPHLNLAWNPDFNWNGSEKLLDHVAVGDFGPDFFNTDMNVLVADLKAHPDYPGMIYRAYGISDVSKLSHNELKLLIAKSLGQFLRSMVSANSKFDRYFNHQEGLTASEQSGYIIFMTERGDCFHCHGNPLFTSNDFRNNGLECDPQGQDRGLFINTGLETDKGKFSTPTLRNISLTAPYMHDGRFQTLEEVVEFYNSGVCLSSPNIDPIMTKAAKASGLNLWPWEKEDLVNFLKTLTDTSFIYNPAYR